MGSGTRPGEIVLKLGKTCGTAIPTNETCAYKEVGDKPIFDIRSSKFLEKKVTTVYFDVMTWLAVYTCSYSDYASCQNHPVEGPSARRIPSEEHCRWEKKTYTQNHEAVLWHHSNKDANAWLKIGDVKGKDGSSINIVNPDASRRRRQSAVTV